MFEDTGFLTLNSSSSSNDTFSGYFTYCKDSPMGYFFWSVVCMIIFLLGFPVSLMELWEFLQRQQITNGFMYSMAVIDLTLTATIPFNVINFNIWQNLLIEFVCSFVHSLTLCGRPLFMACTCMDCYFAVVHPISYMSYRNIRKVRKVACGVVWVISILFGPVMIDAFLSHSYLAAMPLLIALPVITFCDISILQALKKPHPSRNNSIRPKKRQAIYTIINSFIMTFIAYLPPTIIFSFGPLLEDIYSCILVFHAFLFSLSGCVIMPIVYLISVGKLDFLKKWWWR